MGQYIPKVSPNDIERIIVRDFPPESHDEIRLTIKQINPHEKNRVIVACLKNSKGNLERLINEFENAEGYWREIISEVEYPKIKKAWNLTKDQINDKMKEQYLKWFNKK